tara:strand:- start:237 stop:2303 length:2067 start_codon:yes stop_codon:yes gene_type:complete
MKILTQNLKTGKTNILEVPSPSISSKKIRVKNDYSLISTGTESLIVNFGKASWLNKARQQPDRVKDVINKVKSSGITDTYKAIRNKLYYPMVMGYAAVGTVTHKNKNFNLSKGMRVFTNSCHQEEALIDYNMCVKIPDNVDSKSASFGAIGGIAMQSIKCIPDGSKFVAIIGLGLLGQVTLRILNALGYQCIVYDIDSKKVDLAVKYGGKKIHNNNITEEILNHTKGDGVDCTIIAASSPSNQIINEAPSYTRRKGRIISSGLVGLNLIRDKFFKKQVELVVSNSSGDKNHRGKGSSYENINYFFKLLSLEKISVLDLVSEEVSFDDADNIYSFPDDSLFFSKLIKYKNNEYPVHTFSSEKENKSLEKLKAGLIGAGNFAMSILMPTINNTNEGYLHSLLGREGLSLYLAKKRFNINKITTNENDFYEDVDVIFISTPHQTHFDLTMKAIELSMPFWIEKPLVIAINELKTIRKKMFSKQLIFAIGYNRSLAPWTNFMINKINSKKANIYMTINAGKLPTEHWLLDESTCGGRIVGECCHFVDLALTLLKHTNLNKVECVERDRYYQDTGKYILTFEDESKVVIDYRHDLPASIPKEKIVVNVSKRKFINNNWKKFSSNSIIDFNPIAKSKGHNEAINKFVLKVKNNEFMKNEEINSVCFSTFTSLKLQAMNLGDILDIAKCYKNEIS